MSDLKEYNKKPDIHMDDTREGLHSIPIVQITLKTLLKADDII